MGKDLQTLFKTKFSHFVDCGKKENLQQIQTQCCPLPGILSSNPAVPQPFFFLTKYEMKTVRYEWILFDFSKLVKINYFF